MKLLFSEARPDYGHYIFPYAIWGFPEAGETPADLFSRGFLPSSRDLDRFYLCRHVRVNLRRYMASSENRRILRKGGGVTGRLVPRSEYEYGPERREFFRTYADRRFGAGVMTDARLDSLFASRVTSHVMVFREDDSDREVGVATLYLEPMSMAYYYYAFYDLARQDRNLGMYMMTVTVAEFASRGFDYLYLGSCYLPKALYKTQFSGTEFFNGVRWSDNLEELRYLVRRGETEQTGHLLESEAYRAEFYAEDLATLAARSGFRGDPPKS